MVSLSNHGRGLSSLQPRDSRPISLPRDRGHRHGKVPALRFE
jgi:hypothetical protein